MVEELGLLNNFKPAAPDRTAGFHCLINIIL